MVQFGIDPELFVVKKGGSKATSVHLLKGFKPREVKNGSNPVVGSWKPDGFAFEINTQKPTGCRDYLSPAIGQVIKTFHESNEGFTLSPKASMELTVASTRGVVPEGVCDYGCVPDRSAYELEEKAPPDNSYHDLRRYTGGHVHVQLPGFPKQHSLRGTPEVFKKAQITENELSLFAAAMTLLLDRFVAVPMVAMLGNTNNYGEELRRAYYGQAGSHRVKPYGVEYRVLSGMLLQSPFMFTWLIGQMKKTLRSGGSNTPRPVASLFRRVDYYNVPQREDQLIATVMKLMDEWKMGEARAIIDSHNVEAAREMWTATKKVAEWCYRPEFVDALIEADKQGHRLETNMAKAWGISRKIVNHQYPGIEGLLSGNRNILASQVSSIKPFLPAPVAKW